jgi:hypothetical protein
MVMSFGFGNRVVSRWAKRATTSESTRGQPCTAASTMNLNCLFGVLRTTGGKAARRGAAFASNLVPIDGFEQERFHNDINSRWTICRVSRSPTAKHRRTRYPPLDESTQLSTNRVEGRGSAAVELRAIDDGRGCASPLFQRCDQ